MRFFIFRQASLERFIKDKKKKAQFLSSYVLKRTYSKPALQKRNTMKTSSKSLKVTKDLFSPSTFFANKGYEAIIDALTQRGLKFEEDKNKSMTTDFIYMIKAKEIDFHKLPKTTIVNHIQNSQELTRKDTLNKSLKFFNLLGEDTTWFYTVAYEGNEKTEFEDFFDYYKLTQIVSLLKKYQVDPSAFKDQLSTVELAYQVSRRKVDLLHLFCDNFFDDSFESNSSLLINEGEWCHFNRERTDKYKAELTKMNKKLNLPQEAFEEIPIEKLLVEQNDDALIERVDKVLNELREINPQFNISGQENVWIVKPTALSRGRGIQIFSHLTDIVFLMRTSCENYLINKYIENPLLILGRKFDIRQWVLITFSKGFEVYFYNEPYIRFSAEDYDKEKLDNLFSHLTNNSIASKSDKFDDDKIKGNMWNFKQFESYLLVLN